MIYTKRSLETAAPRFVSSLNSTTIAYAAAAVGASSTIFSFAYTGAGPGGLMSLVKLF
jgi:hypothetical protein